MLYKGVLTKMQTELTNPINYYLVFNSDFIHVNQLLNTRITLTKVGEQCLSCNLQRPIYRQGFCKTCFFDQPAAGDWIMRPELSKAHLDIEDRDLEYEKRVQLKPHIVYLANSSTVKVGVTRKTQVPTRWIDQGAHKAIEIVEVPNRYLAGITEVALKAFVADKTNWRKMLKNEVEDEDLALWRTRLKAHLPKAVLPYVVDNTKETLMHFPVHQYPSKPVSLNFNKTPSYTGTLVGIKGQYFIFKDNTVFNVRSNEGSIVELAL